MACKGVGRVHGDQCQYNLEVMHGTDTGAPVKKPTGFMSNGPKILEALSRVCTGRNGICSRRKKGSHAVCSGRIAREAAHYLPTLCRAMLKGVPDELKSRGVTKHGAIGMHAVCDENDARVRRVPNKVSHASSLAICLAKFSTVP